MPTLGTAPIRLSLGQVEMVQESTFGTDPGSGYKYVEVVEQPDVSGIHRLHVPLDSLRQSVDPVYAHVMAPSGLVDEGATFVTTHYLQGFLGSLPGAADILAAVNASTGYPLAWLFRLGLGGQAYGGVGTEDGASPSAVDSVVLGDLDASLIDAGHMYTTVVSGGYDSGFAKVADMATETITPRVNHESAVTNGSTVYGSITSYTADSLPDSMTIRWTGWLEASSTPLRLTLSGCVPASMELTISPRELPRLTVTWRCAKAVWTASASPGAAYTQWVYGPTSNIAVPAPEVVTAIRAIRYTAVDTYADIQAMSLTLRVDNDLQAFKDVNASGGIGTYRMGNRTITLSARVPYTGEAEWEGQTEYGIQCVIGTTPGKRVGISIPRAHISEPPGGPSDESGYAYVDHTYRAMGHASDTEPAGGQAADNRALAIALG